MSMVSKKNRGKQPMGSPFFFSAFISFLSFSSLPAPQDSESTSLSAGESRAEGIGRPAPPIGEAGPIPQRPVGRSRPSHSGRPCRETGSAQSSAAACESDPAPGGPASALRTAVGVRPRPLVPHIPPRQRLSTAHGNQPFPAGAISCVAPTERNGGGRPTRDLRNYPAPGLTGTSRLANIEASTCSPTHWLTMGLNISTN